MSRRGPKVRPEKFQQVMELAQQGLSNSEIARRTGIKRTTIAGYRTGLNVPLGLSVPPGDAWLVRFHPQIEASAATRLLWSERRTRVLDLAGAGQTAAQIARDVPLSKNTIAAWCASAGINLTIGRPGRRAMSPVAHLSGRQRYRALLELGLCTKCERRPSVPGRCRCATCVDYERARRGSDRGSTSPREPMIREWGTFLNEDLAQERILAELEGRAFDKRDFYDRYAPRQEIAVLDRPLGEDRDGDTLHAIHGAPASGSPWLTPRTSGGVANPAEERMVRRLDREPTIEELRAEAEGRPWQSYVHAVSLEHVEEAIAAWLAFIARMTPDELAETNVEAQIEAIMPGLAMGEILRCVRESLAWSERDLERQAGIAPGIVRQMERGEFDSHSGHIQVIAEALSAVAALTPGLLRAHIAAVWGPVHTRAERRVVVESQLSERRRRQAPLTQNLGSLLEGRAAAGAGQ